MVNIIWSTTVGGEGLSDVIDHGSAENGAGTAEQEIFIRHDGGNEITNAGLYIRQYSGTYAGSFTPTSDLTEILSWGNQSSESDFGGFLVNFNAENSYPTNDWPTYDNKDTTNGFVYRSGVGDSEANAVTIPIVSGLTTSTAGEIQANAGTSLGVRFKVRVEVPSSEDEVGIRQWETVLRYSFTS